MRLVNLSIQHFKSIAGVKLPRFHSIDVFIGKNNSGKTNILEAITLFLHAECYPENIFDVQAAEIHAQFQLDAPNCLELKLTCDSATLHCMLSAGQTKSFFTQTDPAAVKVTIPETHARAFLQQHIVHINTSRLLVEYQRSVDTQIRAGDISIFFAQSAYQELSEKYPQAYQDFLTSLHHMFPELSFRTDVQLFTQVKELKALADMQPGYHIRENSRLRRLANLGSGYLQLAVILLFLHHPRYHIIILDEPENHLHIGLQKKLLARFQAAHGKQIFISTHSPLFVTPELFHSLHRVVKDPHYATTIYPEIFQAASEVSLPPASHTASQYTHLSSPTQVSTRYFPYSVDIIRLAQELNLESNEMLFADHVILVEGEADEILFKGLVDRFYRGDREVLVLAVHSNTNFKIYRDVLRYFGIPYCIVTDLDSLHGYIDVVVEALGRRKNMPRSQYMQELKKNHIYVLPNGSLEDHYPKKYQHYKDSKPFNALRAARNITPQELASPQMAPLSEILQTL